MFVCDDIASDDIYSLNEIFIETLQMYMLSFTILGCCLLLLLCCFTSKVSSHGHVRTVS